MKVLSIISALLISCITFSSAYGADESSTKELNVEGFKVIFKHSPKDVISVRLFIDGGTANYPKNKEGIESLALHTAMEAGSKSKNKIAFNTAAEKIGADFSVDASYDFSSINMTCISLYWNESWNLFTDAIMNPSFNGDEFGLIKQQLIVAAKQNESEPDAHLRNLALSKVFEGKNYAKIADGSPESLERLSLEATKAYYDKLIDKKKCFLVVVGNIKEADLISKVKSSFTKLPVGTAAPKEKASWISEADHYIEERDLATNYIRGVFTGPHLASEEAVPMQIAMEILRDRYFKELRTKRSLSYSPQAFYARGVINNPYNVIYISTLDPKQSMQVMVDEINIIKKEGFLEKELNDQKQSFLTYHYLGLETSASQSRDLGLAEIAGDWKMVDHFTGNVNRTTIKDLNKVFDKYTNAIHWIYLGKREMVDAADFVQTKSYKDKPY
ncbi:MAG: insulinase family protein [Chitinophagales bacterium]|nr:insulinase family protein [Chitinophagales bacterium]